MKKTQKTFRFEKKYILDEIRKNQLISKLSKIMEMDTFGNENGYLVRSLYFDSLYDDDYIDKINGLENRKKIRLRIYSADQKNVKLEIKEKTGKSQYKKSVWITRDMALEMIEGDYSSLLSLDSDTAMEIYSCLMEGVYRPKCIIEYDRIAFVESINSHRITFDNHIRASKNYEDFFSENLVCTPIMNTPVLEVKYNRFLLDPIKAIINCTDSLEESMSKYTLCREILG